MPRPLSSPSLPTMRRASRLLIVSRESCKRERERELVVERVLCCKKKTERSSLTSWVPDCYAQLAPTMALGSTRTVLLELGLTVMEEFSNKHG
jgi:hypothetical protein